MRLALLVVVMVAGLAPAAHAERDYPWCLYGGEFSPAGECMYETREQCLASASGRWNLYCDLNLRVRFKQQQQQQLAPPQRQPR